MSERCSEDCFWVDDDLEYCPISQKCCCIECDKNCEKRCHTSSQIFKRHMDVLERIERGEGVYLRVYEDVRVPIDHDEEYNDSRRNEEKEAELLRLARIGQQMQWIPVSERLPENGIDVMVVDLHGNRKIVYLDGNHWIRDCLGKEISYLISEFTHWMPLPEPPKEGGE